MSGISKVVENLRQYKRKYYLNRLIRGGLFFCSLVLSYFIIIATVEFTFEFDTMGRGILFFSFLAIIALVGYKWVVDPIIKIIYIKSQISDEEAAKQIGQYFPEVGDKLLNTLQLSSSNVVENSLLAASIAQRTSSLSVVQFPKAIDLSYNKKYLKYLIIPVISLVVIFIVIPQMITESTGRIIKFQHTFEPSAPFQFIFDPQELIAYKNEDFKLDLKLEGSLYPDQVFLVNKGRKIKMEKNSANHFTYEFKKIKEKTTFYIEASGFLSSTKQIQVFSRPNLKNYNVLLEYPRHVGLENEFLKNAGNLEVPEGTVVTWQFGTLDTDKLALKFKNPESEVLGQIIENQIFEVKKQVFDNDEYDLILNNDRASNKEKISYSIAVIKDQFPSIVLDPIQDTTLYSYIIIGGSISDDYGISNLKLFYQRQKQQGFTAIDLPIAKGQSQQNYFYNWKLDSLKLSEGESLEYFVQVWDNDGINGFKSSKTANYSFKVPSRKEIRDNLDKQSKSAEKQIENAVKSAEELQEQIKEIDNRLKSKKNLDWQDEKLVEELLKKREQLENDIKKLQEKNNDFLDKKERFNESSEKIKEKVDALKKLMDELLDDETKKLYQELQKLLEEKSSMDSIREMMNKIENKEDNVEKEIERALELFKRLQMDFKMEEIIKDLGETIEDQKSLNKETQDKGSDMNQLAEKQEEINNEFKEIQESIEDLEELNDNLKSPQSLEDTEKEQKETEKNLQDAKENLDKQQRDNAGQKQKNAAKSMEQLKEKMMSMQQSMEMTMMEENLDDLRDILDNLVKLSFDQENLMNDFKAVNQSDPRFVTLSQKQLQLKDNAKVIEDSLLSLASRVFQIASFVTREVDAMNDYMEESLDALKERNKALAVSKQQFTMTSMNNLALLLDDVMQQMQQAMADAKGVSKSGKKKGSKDQMPSLSDLQKQLNQKIDDLKKSGASGRELSEQLAKMAAEQEMIRQQLQEMQQMMNNEDGEAGKNMQELLKKMEETETDLVNKRLTEQMKMRQQEIMTRLLKAENSMRERELDDKREGETANKTGRELPPAFEEYLRLKEKEIELLKTIPLQLNPYYKREVNEYFKRLGQD